MNYQFEEVFWLVVAITTNLFFIAAAILAAADASDEDSWSCFVCWFRLLVRFDGVVCCCCDGGGDIIVSGCFDDDELVVEVMVEVDFGWTFRVVWLFFILCFWRF